MKKSHLGIMLGIMVLAAGCAPQSAEMAAIEETVESTETEGPEHGRMRQKRRIHLRRGRRQRQILRKRRRSRFGRQRNL